MGNYSIRLKKPDEKLDATVKQIRVGSNEILTPYKTYTDLKQDGICEFSQTFSEDVLMQSASERTRLCEIPKKYNASVGHICVMLPRYVGGDISDKALEYMDNWTHPYTDVVTVPRWEGLITKDNGTTYFEENWGLSKRYIDEVRKLNGKLILGNIPMNHPVSVISKLVDSYTKEGITSFVLDYERCNTLPKAYLVRDISKKLVEYATDNDNYIFYNINMRRSHDYYNLKPADDFLSFVNGIDVIGNYHLQGGNGDRPKFDKVFNGAQWTYEDRVAQKGMSGRIKLENHKKINIEADLVKSTIIESGTASNLLHGKAGAKEYSFMAHQTELDFGGIGF